jgi:glycosyltransferase involved in cell wall biosynthesis
VHNLIEALSIEPNWKLRIIGDGPERKSLEHQAIALGVRNRIQFMGACDNSELPHFLSGVCGLILPTLQTSKQEEQFGKTAYEGGAMGLPVLVSKSGHLKNFQNRYATTVFTTGTDPDSLSRSILTLLQNPPTPNSLANSRNEIISNVGVQAVGQAMEQWFLDQLKNLNHDARESIQN